MQIIQCQSKDQAVSKVATILFETICDEKRNVFGLATGRTMEPVYAELVKLMKNSGKDFSNKRFFMLDEYYGLTDNHESSFKFYIKTHFQNPMGFKDDQFFFPPVHLSDAGQQYERDIRAQGGVELQLLGIGQNGHIGFNEPGSEKDSLTRRVDLTPDTIEANREQFVDDIVPVDALSMGIGTILRAKELVLLATGKSKADTIQFLVNNQENSSCPASFLKNHPRFTLVLDPEAASKIN